jgi:hypothetical protein
MDLEAELAETPMLERTAEQEAKLQLYLRYKTTAERSFYRAFYAVRGLRKDKLKEELDLTRVREIVRKEARREVRREAQASEEDGQKAFEKQPAPKAGADAPESLVRARFHLEPRTTSTNHPVRSGFEPANRSREMARERSG